MKVRLSDYVMQFLAERGVRTVFTVCGGGSIFLNDALGRSKIGYVACHHEQGAAFAAEGYARAAEALGVCLVTSGPGGTNAVTGCAAAWVDHVPVLFISGQVFQRQTIAGHPGLRTMGVQEINIVDIARPITKYAVMVQDPMTIRQHLETAVHVARSGRPGPVWLDIPADVQNAQIEVAMLRGVGVGTTIEKAQDYRGLLEQIEEIITLLKTAKRPVVHIGQGVRIAKALPELMRFLDLVRVPVLTARNGADLIAEDHPLYIGRPGTFAQRGANFAVQTADVYLAIGTRLSLAQTGYNARDYARNAKIIMVDVDRAELEKDTVRLHMKVEASAAAFLVLFISQVRDVLLPDWSLWLARCKAWQATYPAVADAQRAQSRYLNSYALIDLLSDALTPEDIVVTDMGFAFQNTYQAFRVKLGQRLMTNCGLAPMGWGMPAAIGAAAATGRRVICIVGDGGLMMNVQELATLHANKLPVKLFVLNNEGYLTMRQSQAHAFSGYMGSDEATGLTFPHFGTLAYAHHISFWRLLDYSDARVRLREVLEGARPAFCEVMMSPEQAQIPKSLNRRNADGTLNQTLLEDAHPFLPKEEVEANLKEPL